MLRKIIRVIFCKILFRVKYINSNLETNIQNCVVCSNHLCASDPFFLYADSDNLSIMAKAELFKFKPFGFILKKAGVFPIHRGEKDVKSIKHAVSVIKKDETSKLLIFPEGTRVRDGKRVRAKVGAVYIALKAGVPILPVRIIKKNPKKTFFTKVYVIYGDPIRLDKEKSKDKEYLRIETEKMMDYIYNLKLPDDLIDAKKSKNKTEKIKIHIDKEQIEK